MTTDHDVNPREGDSELVTVTVQQLGGAIYTLSGLVAAGTPMLVSLNSAQFCPMVAVEGTNLVFRALSGPSTLGAIVGKILF